MKQELLENIIVEELKKSDILDVVKRDKDFEKRVKEIIADVLGEFFRVLWQHGAMIKTLVK